MRTRNSDATKSITPKKTTPARKSATKATPDSTAATDSPTLKSTESKRTPAAKAKQAKINESSPIIASDSNPDQSIVVEEAKAEDDATLVAPKKRTVVRKVVKKVVKKAAGKAKTPTSSVIEAVTEDMPIKEEESVKVNDAENMAVDGKDSDSGKKQETDVERFVESTEEEGFTSEVGEPAADTVQDIAEKGKAIMEVEEPVVESVTEIGIVGDCEEKEQTAMVTDVQSVTEIGIVGDCEEKEQTAMVVDVQSLEVNEVCKNQEPSSVGKGEEANEETKEVEIKEEKRVEAEENVKDESRVEDNQSVQDDYGVDEGYEGYADRVDLEDHGEDDFVEEDPEEIIEEIEVLEDERKELTAAVKERKMKKEYEIFVGGLDREATEEDVRRVFETIGEVVEVRLHRSLSMNKSKGYAFVKFANKEHAKRALSEMRNPVICGKRCGTALSEDNDTLFLGNICNTWTKEAIRQKLKDYGVEGVENITLVADVQHEGRSRGFAFLEFSCHADAMHAYKRLQKPDVVFGHPERTAKVAFAEPIREPDPEVMAQVKTVFLDGLPPHWDEDRVREHLHGYGEIMRIVLARNMSTAKRKDFGFVDFSSHEAAIACIERINNMELSDGNLKVRVKARLSNPMPKTQAVKGGMCGGFLIDRTGSGTSSRFGRSFRRGGHHFNRGNFQRGRGFYQHGHGQPSRMDPNEYDFNNRYNSFRGRQISGQGGRRGPFRGSYFPAGRSATGTGPSRINFNRPWYDAPERGHRDLASSRRQPFSPEEAFDGPYVGRNFNDPYFYDDSTHRMKRPFYMTDHDPDYAEPSRHRPRLDYTDPAVPFRGAHYHDMYGTGSNPYSHGHYGPDYGAYPPDYRGDGPYRGGYYY